ncbi:MAG: hypothetical protein J3R72DRAFT_469805 [Linnemannia gamsii]|nr:MAG: hypothetical protein J3R72DRAFT_469805 [Linnemannia gamsii]
MFSLIKNESKDILTCLAPYEKSKFLGSGGSMVARLKLKGIDGRAPPGLGQRLLVVNFLEGLLTISQWKSVMPLDVLGRTRATLIKSTSLQPWPEGLGNLLKLDRAGDISVSHQLALITSLPFVHTARRYYRLNGLVRLSDWTLAAGNSS